MVFLNERNVWKSVECVRNALLVGLSGRLFKNKQGCSLNQLNEFFKRTVIGLVCKTGNNDGLVIPVRKSNQFNFKLPLRGVVLPLAKAQYFECKCGCNWLSTFEVFKINTDFFRRKVCNWERYLRCVGFFF